jgi:hypothetical protein
MWRVSGRIGRLGRCNRGLILGPLSCGEEEPNDAITLATATDLAAAFITLLDI